MVQAFRLLSRAPTVAAVLICLGILAVTPSAAEALPHFYTNLVKLEEGVREPIISYGHLGWGGEPGPVIECEIAAGGYIENPVGGGTGQEVTQAFDAYDCIDNECETAGGHIGVIAENENAPGLRNQINWPGELTEAKVGTIRLKISNVAQYMHCQFGYTAPTEKVVSEGPFKGREERNTAEYNAQGWTCTTKPPFFLEPTEISGTSLSKPAETEFGTRGGYELECGVFKVFMLKKLASAAYNRSTNVPLVIEVKSE
jgi:hypothetical protein